MNNNYIPNTSSIPNILFDYWMDKLSPAEFKVLMCVARKACEWNKSSNSISIDQIQEMTRLSRNKVIKSVKNLVDHGLINQIEQNVLSNSLAQITTTKQGL